jgi:hypothetical protein
MFNPNAINTIDYLKNRKIDHKPGPQASCSTNYLRTAPEEAEALMLLLETSVAELNKPMAVVLKSGERLLAQTEPETLLTKELEIILNEIRHMHEVVRGLQILTHYQTDTPAH